MDLVVSPTRMEIQPFIDKGDLAPYLVCGVGVVESAMAMSRFLAEPVSAGIDRVIHVGVAGAYCDRGVELLDICLAQREIFADFAISRGEELVPFVFSECPDTIIEVDSQWRTRLAETLEGAGLDYKTGNFLTVNSVSGTKKRGDYLSKRFGAICENMEGFAVGRVCKAFNIPFTEIRCVSNMVEGDSRDGWQIPQACKRLADALEIIFMEAS